MEYKKTKEAVFIKRPNRFLAEVEFDGKNELVHVKNTGRLKELLKKGVKVILEEGDNPNRKTRYSLIAVYKRNEIVKREVKYGNSRFDLYYEKDCIKGFIEVKGVTLDVCGTARFPDAPTERGAKHIRELIKAQSEGYKCAVLFVIQMKNIKAFEPNYDTDIEFAKALYQAEENGVSILAYDCINSKNSMIIDKRIEVIVKDCLN